MESSRIKHPALEELYEILKEKDWTPFCPERNREKLLNEWVDKWVVDLERSQAVVNPKKLTSEASDTIRVYMAQVLAEALAEECTIYKVEEKRIDASLVALRRKAK